MFDVQQFTWKNQAFRYGVLKENAPNAPQQRPIVFIPGMAGTVKNGLMFLNRFTKDQGPVYSLDARGFGLNEHLSPQLNIADYLHDLDRFVTHLKSSGALQPGQQPVLVGLSLGGVLASLYTLHFPRHPFTAQILAAPAFKPHPGRFTRRYRVQNYAKLLYQGWGAKTFLPYGLADLTRNPQPYGPDFSEDPFCLPTLYMLFIERICTRAYKQGHRMTLPTALLIPEQDRVCDPYAMQQVFHRLKHPQNTLLSYPDVFHDIFVEPEEDQARIYQDVSSWLNRLAGLPYEERHLQPV